MIRSFVFKDKKVLKDVSSKQLKKFLKDKKATVWIDIQKPADEEYNFLKDCFVFHPLSIDDCRKSIELPKIDTFDEYLFIVLYTVTVKNEEFKFYKREIDFFLGKNFMVSVHKEPSPGVENMIDKIGQNKNKSILTPDFLLYELIDFAVDLYFPMLNSWEDHIEKLEAEVIQHKHQKNILKQIMSIKRELLSLRRSIAPQIEMVNKFTKKNFPFIHPRTSVYFKDVYDHLMRIYSELETQRDLLKNVFDTHTTAISKQMTETSNKMNEVMQKLTIIATIFMPLTFITGIYGMNFRYMPELYWRYGYFIILGIMFLVGLMMYWSFRKRRWV